MGPLATRVRKQIESIGVDVDSITARFLDGLKKDEDDGAPLDAGVVSSKLAGLLEGDDEGIEFFFESPERIAGLATATGLDEEALVSLNEAQAEFRVVILDPRLPLAPRRYIKRRQTRNSEKFAVIEPEGRRLEDLKSAALGAIRPIVVLTDEKGEGDDAFFAEADLETTAVYWHRRGYLLEGAPELVPEPPAPPPRLVDDDEMPMMPLEELEAEILEGDGCDEKERVQTIVEQGGIPTFRIEDVLRFHAENQVGEECRWVDTSSDEEGENLFVQWLARGEETLLWSHKGKVYFIGPDGLSLLDEIREHHSVTTPECFARASKQLDALNPFRCVDREGNASFTGGWEDIRQQVLEECGVDITPAFAMWRERVETRARPKHAISQRAPALEAKARAALESIILRPVSIDIDEADFVFALRTMASSPLVVIPPESFDLFHVISHLGMGKLLWARAISFPGEQPRPLRRHRMVASWEGYEDAECFDGGDIRLWIRLWKSELLGA